MAVITVLHVTSTDVYCAWYLYLAKTAIVNNDIKYLIKVAKENLLLMFVSLFNYI